MLQIIMLPETVAYLLIFAVTHSGLAAPPVLPSIQQMPKTEMLALVCADEPPDCPTSNIVAAFLPHTYRIVALDTFDFDLEEFDASFLVHELVHAAQYWADSKFIETCEKAYAAETQAYKVQNEYLREHGQLYVAGAAMKFFHCDKEIGK